MTDTALQAVTSAFPLIVPEAILIGFACVLFVGSTFSVRRGWWALLSLVGLVAAGVSLALIAARTPERPPEALTAAVLVLDPLALLVRVLALVGGGVLVFLSWEDVPERTAAEYYGCLLTAIAGLSLTGSANELITLFLALELISIPTYILLYLPRSDAPAQEAALKYFLLSVFSSALLLFGFSYLYGLTGTTSIPGLVDAVGQEDLGRLAPLVLVALAMVVAGLGFRITAVPFHFYAPDVYQGTATIMAAFLAFLPKVAGFTALLRLLGFWVAGALSPLLGLGDRLPILFWLLAVATMTLGNVLALLQHNLKRLLAYSSVAHAGYMLIGIAVALPAASAGSLAPASGGASALLFYLVAYSAMTVGAFGVLAYLSTPERRIEVEDDLAGLSRTRPGMALLMALFLFSLIGIPLTGGFSGKFLLFWSAMGEPGRLGPLFRWLALVAVLNSAVGAYYYLRILARMYLYPPVQQPPPERIRPALFALWICGIVTIVLGCYPAWLQQQLNPSPATAPALSAVPTHVPANQSAEEPRQESNRH